MADETTGRNRDAARDAVILGYDSNNGSLVLLRNMNQAPASSDYGLVVRVAGSSTANPSRAGTGTETTVNDSASSVTLLAANSNRLGATVFNDSSANLYLKLGATASTTSFSIKIAAGGYYEVPFGYTGIIDGIWSSAAGGAARVTELTA